MSRSDLAISVRGLSKSYSISHEGASHSTAAEAMLHRLRNPLRSRQSETFWALRDLSFDVNRGEVVGIVGRNGAGKSTLLKVLSRITEPTAGEIDLYGGVGSLLEVGTGFHPELTGRENVYLNGAILGMRRREIDNRFEEIVDFAGVERFLDTPVKRYSSGMYVRLAFAVAAHLNPQILIIDEVLAVGDAAFQARCLGKMKEVAHSGRTVLFVSHNMEAVRRLCHRCLLLSDGRLECDDAPSVAIGKYLERGERSSFREANQHGLTLKSALLVDVTTNAPTQWPLFGGCYTLDFELHSVERLARAALVAEIHSDTGELVSTACTVEEGLGFLPFHNDVKVSFELKQMRLLPGRYHVSASVYRANDSIAYLSADRVVSFEVQPQALQGGDWPYRADQGVFRIADSAKVSSEELTAGDLSPRLADLLPHRSEVCESVL